MPLAFTQEDFLVTENIYVVGGEQLEMEPILNDTNVRFWCPELTQEGQWRHVTLVFNRAGIMKNSSVSLYVDGQHVNTQKVRNN